jgi:hypothetical protein
MQSTSLPDRPTARQELVLQRVGNEWVLFDSRNDRAHVLNLTAAVVWTYCDGTHHSDAIAAAIARELPSADQAMLRADVEDVLRRFADEGLLQ